MNWKNQIGLKYNKLIINFNNLLIISFLMPIKVNLFQSIHLFLKYFSPKLKSGKKYPLFVKKEKQEIYFMLAEPIFLQKHSHIN
jgi:hypothetical protein